ncbi:MAG: Nif3-like dinuclear metal center hexameric protein [Halobacteriales archaeon]|nr:Nif3-like dinuclear metal center hexameric protein [Halobacteriales archaeon]
MRLGELAGRYDDRLRTDAFADVDKSANGIQVGDPDAEIERVAYAVDAVQATIEAAVDADADLLCAHHGIVWGGLDRVTGRSFDRISTLIENDLALYAAHLPLDAHLELGNAAGVADLLELDGREPFGEAGAETVGLRGRVADGPIPADELEARLADGLGDVDPPVRALPFGPDPVEAVGVVTGAGGDYLEAAAEAGLDALVTGEGSQSLYHRAREEGVTVLLGGHYATETFGVRRLQSLAEGWGLETAYIDWPTGF